jgi:hypothetical protein
MALLWCDGFDHYGTSPNGGRDAMLAGVWAELSGGISAIPRISTTHARTGGHALYFPENNSAFESRPQARRLLGADKSVVGIGFGLYMPEIFAGNNRTGFQLRNNANGVVLTFAIQSDASIEVFRGTPTGTSIGRSGQALTAQAWNHVEVRVRRHATEGSVEIRVNGVTVLDIAEENTGGNDFASVVWGAVRNSATDFSYEFYIDDVFAWDDQGSSNNDFLGPLGVYTLFPDDDTLDADWSVTGAGTGFAAIDDAAPDDDSSYIAAGGASDVSAFEVGDLPGGISQVAAVVAVSRMRKTDAGDGNVQMGLVSSEVGSPPLPAVAFGEDRPITEVYTYWQDVFELDPATGGAWTPAAVNSVRLRMERTA